MEIVISSLKCLTLYIVIIICLRLLGKKRLAQLYSADLAFMVLIGSTLGQQLPEDKFLGGIAAIGTLSLANYLINIISLKFPAFRRLIDGNPAVIIKDGKVQKDIMDSEMVTEEHLKEVMRNSEVEDIKEVKIGVIETTGKINLIKDKDK